ncbi:LapA family protein [Prauserella rugosa]|uniref:Putative integral membrane protein n=1 Tax=Prauserella rugosa TaxID=43354 RepID=A0A660CDU8_9PSEU|nr:LapA family protein [Prauserella rugosa]KMS84285.1 hypothetical protein ACZ91_48605 [Streptomyces regensis]TWH19111.1 putative integral membrane protein [Prauserella rugosa]
MTHSRSSAGDHSGDTTTSVNRTRSGGLWVGLIVAAIVLVLLLVFILQNLQRVQINLLGFDGHMPLAVAILLGVAAGAVLIAVPGTVRIMQLRRNVRRGGPTTPTT